MLSLYLLNNLMTWNSNERRKGNFISREIQRKKREDGGARARERAIWEIESEKERRRQDMRESLRATEILCRTRKRKKETWKEEEERRREKEGEVIYPFSREKERRAQRKRERERRRRGGKERKNIPLLRALHAHASVRERARGWDSPLLKFSPPPPLLCWGEKGEKMRHKSGERERDFIFFLLVN